jgi:hypothetical protein
MNREQIIAHLKGSTNAIDVAVADMFEKGGIDHLRLVRIERMLEFLLSKQTVEVPRRLSQAELTAYAAAKLPAPLKVMEQRTWLDEFNAQYAEFLNKLQTPKPAAPAAEGEPHA